MCLCACVWCLFVGESYLCVCVLCVCSCAFPGYVYIFCVQILCASVGVEACMAVCVMCTKLDSVCSCSCSAMCGDVIKDLHKCMDNGTWCGC